MLDGRYSKQSEQTEIGAKIRSLALPGIGACLNACDAAPVAFGDTCGRFVDGACQETTDEHADVETRILTSPYRHGASRDAPQRATWSLLSVRGICDSRSQETYVSR